MTNWFSEVTDGDIDFNNSIVRENIQDFISGNKPVSCNTMGPLDNTINEVVDTIQHSITNAKPKYLDIHKSNKKQNSHVVFESFSNDSELNFLALKSIRENDIEFDNEPYMPETTSLYFASVGLIGLYMFYRLMIANNK